MKHNEMINLTVLACLVLLLASCRHDYVAYNDGYIWLNRGLYTESPNQTIQIVVHPNVTAVVEDRDYISAKQVPDRRSFDVEYKYWYQEGAERDSAVVSFRKSCDLGVCYWIINKKTHQVYGPLTKEEYVHKRDSLKVKLWPTLD